MKARTIAALAGIALVVAGLSAWRAGRRGEAPGPSPAAPAAAAAPLPRVLDFGRDT